MQEPCTPLISVVIVCLNAQAFIREALDSVLGQSFDDYELIVVDGGSSDGTTDILREYETAFAGRLRWVSGPDEGLYDAMNKGLRLARGRYVVYLGADDRLASGALAGVADAVRVHDGPDIVAGATRVFGGAREWIQPPMAFASDRMPKRAPAVHQSLYVTKESLVAVQGFETGYQVAADYDLYLKLRERGAREVMIPEVLSEFRLGGVSSSDSARTAREYRDVRIAHGAGRAGQQLVMLKSRVAAFVVGLARGVDRARRT
jgi:glycosyltransferase involved in cell wall biosynthesis